MSPGDPPLSLTKRAQRDLRSVLLYSLRTWGPHQADVYANRIDNALERIRVTPMIGRSRDELRRGPLSFPVEQYVLYYRITTTRIEVLRILHQRINAARQFGA